MFKHILLSTDGFELFRQAVTGDRKDARDG